MARLILSLDGQLLAEYNMNKERYTVGRLPDNDIRIDNPTVSGHHSLLINILNDSFLEDLNSTNGTYVNGRLIKKHALQNGDVITVGRHQLRFLDGSADEEDDEFASTMVIDRPQAEAFAARLPQGGTGVRDSDSPVPRGSEGGMRPVQNARVQVLSGSFAGREIALNKALTTLGRAGAQVVAITRRGDGYYAVQVENVNGSPPARVNGDPLGAQARRLEENDVLEIVGIKMGFFLS